MKHLLNFMVLAVVVALPGRAQSLSVMRYDSPATCFDDALPIGNGHIGVMVYGGTSEARFGLNEATVWGGIPAVNTVEDGPAKLAAIREAKAAGDALGGSVECAVLGLPAGLGDPIFGGMENRIAGICEVGISL